MDRSELRRRVRTHLAAAQTALDSVPEHDALVAVLVTAEGAPQAPQPQSVALLLQKSVSQSLTKLTSWREDPLCWG